MKFIQNECTYETPRLKVVNVAIRTSVMLVSTQTETESVEEEDGEW